VEHAPEFDALAASGPTLRAAHWPASSHAAPPRGRRSRPPLPTLVRRSPPPPRCGLGRA
jgi:hypothetical protein